MATSSITSHKRPARRETSPLRRSSTPGLAQSDNDSNPKVPSIGGNRRDSAALSREIDDPPVPDSEHRIDSLLSALAAPEPEPVPSEQSMVNEPTFDESVSDHHQSILETAESREVAVDPEARVAILDSFGTDTVPGHGDAVEYVFQEATPETQPEVQRFQVSPTSQPPSHLFTAPGDATPEERLQAFVEQSALDPLMQTNAALDSILNDPDSAIRTINQSQGISPASQARVLHRFLYERNDSGDVVLTDEGGTILDALGMDSSGGASREQNIEFAERATRRIEEIFETSEPLGRELSRHSELSEQLAEQGVSYVVSAGNDADFGTQMGAQLEGGFDDDLLTNPHNITVGAVDQSTGRLAEFSSGDPEVDYLASGVDIRVGDAGSRTASGTSFSAPLVADRLDSLRQENPDISQQQLLLLLEESFGSQQGDLEHLVIS